MKVGLFGGTFDPIHNGHLHVISSLISHHVVDKLLVIPAGDPQLRDAAPGATGAQRRQMCQLAINSLPADIRERIEVNPIEILREGPSYTMDTVEAVAQTYPDADLILVVGTDAYSKIDQWHRADELKKRVEFCVIDRPDFPGKSTLNISALKVSATDIRAGRSDALPAAVAAFIKENNLYAS